MGFQKYLGIDDSSVSIAPGFCYPPTRINYLHGRIDKEESWIFTSTHYINSYDINGAPCMEFIKKIFENYSVIFIGYGLREHEILRGINRSKKNRQHFWLE
jgi:hypothetical protein